MLGLLAWQMEHAQNQERNAMSFCQGHKEIVQLLLERGADVRVRDKHGNDPLSLATKKGFKEIVSIFEAADKSQGKAVKGEGENRGPERRAGRAVQDAEGVPRGDGESPGTRRTDRRTSRMSSDHSDQRRPA